MNNQPIILKLKTPKKIIIHNTIKPNVEYVLYKKMAEEIIEQRLGLSPKKKDITQLANVLAKIDNNQLPSLYK